MAYKPLNKSLPIFLFFTFLFGLASTTICNENTDSVFTAVRECNQSYLSKYIETESSLNVSDTNGWPLIMALIWSQVFSYDVACAGRDCKPFFKNELFHNYKENISLLNRFLEHNVDLTKSNREGVTPLMLIVLTGHYNDTVADLLIKKGADIHCKDKLGNNLLHIATSQSNLEYLFHFDVYQTSPLIDERPKGKNQLYRLAHWSKFWKAYTRLKIIKLLINNGADINARNNDGKTPLDLAQIEYWIDSTQNNQEVVKYLTSNGAKLTISDESQWLYKKDNKERTALQRAALTGQFDTVKKMVNLGLEIDHQDTLGYTALMLSVLEGHYNIAEYLLSKKANPNKIDNYNRTALMFAARKGNLTMVKLLISNGADRSIELNHQITAIEIAEVSGHKKVVEYLRNQNTSK